MTYTAPKMILEVGLSSGPIAAGVTPSGGWTDLSSRMLEFDMDRGRQDETAEFEPGTITVTLDNTDRMLDPDYASSLVYRGADLGLPLCPVRVTCDYAGSNYPIFFGAIGPEAWIVDRSPAGTESVSTLQAFDTEGVFALLDLPPSPFAAAIQVMDPNYWNRGDSLKPVLGNGDTMPAEQFGGGTTTIVDSGGGEKVTITGGLATGDPGTGMACDAGAFVVADATAIFGTFTTTAAMTASVIWQSATLTGDAGIIRMTDTASGNHRWRVYCNNTGVIVLDMYDNLGTIISFNAAPVNPSGGRWDDGSPHIVMVRYNQAGSELAVWVDGLKAAITLLVPVAYTVASVYVGATNFPVTVDEVVVWNRAVTATDLGHLWGCHKGTSQPFHHDNYEDRIQRWYDLVGWIIDGSEPAEWHYDTSGPRSLWGFGSVNSMPSNLADALRQVAESGLGVTWATREGRVRVRTMAALTDPGYFTDYADSVAELTDAPSPAGPLPTVRRGVVGKTGVRTDRIINRAEVTYGIDGGGSIPSPVTPVVMAAVDTASQVRYGTRVATYTTDWIDGDVVTAYPQAVIDRWAVPPVEVRDVSIDCWGFDNETAFIIQDCELERLVTVVDTPPVGAPWTADMNIQGESWSWVDGVSWTVTLSLAAS